MVMCESCTHASKCHCENPGWESTLSLIAKVTWTNCLRPSPGAPLSHRQWNNINKCATGRSDVHHIYFLLLQWCVWVHVLLYPCEIRCLYRGQFKVFGEVLSHTDKSSSFRCVRLLVFLACSGGMLTLKQSSRIILDIYSFIGCITYNVTHIEAFNSH